MSATSKCGAVSTITMCCLALGGCSGGQGDSRVEALAPSTVPNGGNTNSSGGARSTFTRTNAESDAGGSSANSSRNSSSSTPPAGGAFGLGGAATDLGGRGGSGGSTSSEIPRGGRGTTVGSNTSGPPSTGGTNSGGRASGTAGASVSNSAAGGVSGGTTATSGQATGGRTSGGATSAAGAGIGGSVVGGASSGGSRATTTTSSVTTPIKIWIAGDSTVQNCSSTCPCGWGSALLPLFNQNVTVVNSAVGGRSIQTWLYESAVSSTLGSNGECTLTSQSYHSRWTAMTDPSKGMKAGDYLLIDFGINDGDSSCPRHVGTSLYKTYLGVMAKAALAVGAHPVFLTPTNAITCSGSKVTENRGFLTETKAAGADNAVPVIDLNQLSMDLYAKLGFCPNDGNYSTGALGAFFCEDHTHFEAAGAAQIAALIAQALKDQGIGLALYLR